MPEGRQDASGVLDVAVQVQGGSGSPDVVRELSGAPVLLPAQQGGGGVGGLLLLMLMLERAVLVHIGQHSVQSLEGRSVGHEHVHALGDLIEASGCPARRTWPH